LPPETTWAAKGSPKYQQELSANTGRAQDFSGATAVLA
jgi:hypothetical protein